MSLHVEDRGILVAPLKRFLWNPLLRWVPRGASANGMTLLGTTANIAATVIGLSAPPSQAKMALVAFLLFTYFCMDNLDGAYARKTGTQSPLGEFLDHWLDAINSTCIALCAAICWEMRGAPVIILVASVSTAYTMTHWEHRVTGRLYFGYLGNVEGIAAVISAHAAQAIFGPHAVASFPVFRGYSATDLVGISTVLTCVVIAVGVLARARRWASELPLLFAGVAAVLAWYFLGDVPFLPLCGLLVLLTPLTGGRMVVSRLVARPRLGADQAFGVAVIVAAAVCIALRPDSSVQATVAIVLLVLAFARVVLDFAQTLLALSCHIRPGEFLAWFVRRRRVH